MMIKVVICFTISFQYMFLCHFHSIYIQHVLKLSGGTTTYYTLKKYSSIMFRGLDLHFLHHDINTGGRDEPPFKGGWLLVSVPNCDYFLVTYRFKIEDKWHIQFRSVHNCRCT